MYPDIINEYSLNHTSNEDDILYELSRETHLKTVYPAMLAGKMQGKLLEMISCMIKPQLVLEIGTFTGYSTICLAKGLKKKGFIHTIERNNELEEIAMKYYNKAGIHQQVIYHTGEAIEIIASMKESFDLVFIDCDKKDYPSVYRAVVEKVKPGGFILVDNVLWYGKITQNTKIMDKDTLGVHQLNEIVNQDKRVENVLLTLRDGLMLVRKI